MEKESCDVSTLIPEGCYQCGEKAGKFCTSQDEGKYTNIIISSQTILTFKLVSNTMYKMFHEV